MQAFKFEQTIYRKKSEPFVSHELFLNLGLVGGANLPPPYEIFLNNSGRENFIVMKLLDFLQLLIVQLLKTFY